LPRHARLDAPGTLHHVIIRGIERRRIINDDEDRMNFTSRMGGIASDTGTIIYAWALMTNHAHILLRSSEFGLSRYIPPLPYLKHLAVPINDSQLGQYRPLFSLFS